MSTTPSPTQVTSKRNVVMTHAKKSYCSSEYCKVVIGTLGNHGHELIQWIDRNCDQRGELETAKMMKQRMNFIQHLLADDLNDDQLQHLSKEYKISIDTRTRYPKGIFGLVAHNLVNSSNIAVERELLGILHGYTMLSPKIGYDELQELLEPIISDSTGDAKTEALVLDVFCNSNLSKSLVRALKGLEINGEGELDLLRSNKCTKERYTWVPQEGSGKNFRAILESDSNVQIKWIRSLLSTLPFHEPHSRLWKSEEDIYDRNGFNLTLLGDIAYPFRDALYSTSSPFGGRVQSAYAALNPVPKPGAAGRIVAKLSAWDQLYLEPLHRVLDSVLVKCPTFCHDDQIIAGYQAGLGLSDLKSHPIAVDLSNATDRLPVSLFTSGCDRNGLDRISSYIKEIATQNYVLEVPKLPIKNGTLLNYKVGQPMGAFGSFPILQITNYMVAFYANHVISGSYFSPDCVIVGDDICFSDKNVGLTYTRTMNQLGVKTNPSKQFSNNLLQMVGFDIIRNSNVQDGYFLVRPYKFKPKNYIGNKDTILGLGYNYPSVTPLLVKTKPFIKVVGDKKRSDFMEDLTPAVPRDKVTTITTSYEKTLNRIGATLNTVCSQLRFDVDLTRYGWSRSVFDERHLLLNPYRNRAQKDCVLSPRVNSENYQQFGTSQLFDSDKHRISPKVDNGINGREQASNKPESDQKKEHSAAPTMGR